MDQDEHRGDLLPLLLGICEDFFANAGPAVHHKVDELLQVRHITGGPGWLIDMLALTRQRLEASTEPGGSRPEEAADTRKSGAQTHRH